MRYSKFLSAALAAAALMGAGTPIRAVAGERGGWHSSGGGLYGDEKNPFFVRNTPAVQYCVKVDTASVTASADTVRRLIQEGLAYWKVEFAKASMQDGDFGVGSQSFVEVDCATGIQAIEFLVGYGTLNPDQISFLDDPTRFVGVTVRTDYDRETLRGKGFVYISSDRGPHAYSNGMAGSVVPEAWRQERLLFYAIIHELGHVFGLPHSSSGLMSEVFLQQLLNPVVTDIFVNTPIDPFFYPENHLEDCSTLDGTLKAWLGSGPEVDCLAIDDPRLGTVRLRGHNPRTKAWEDIGTIQVAPMDVFSMRFEPAVVIQLPAEQKVFTAKEANFRSFLLGPSMVNIDTVASYKAVANPVPRSLFMHLTSNSMVVVATVNGKSRPIFQYMSTLMIKLFMSQPSPSAGSSKGKER